MSGYMDKEARSESSFPGDANGYVRPNFLCSSATLSWIIVGRPCGQV
jgi:hypothetical protein